MKVNRLKLHGFMSYEDVDLEPGPGLSLVTGANGSGKSGAFVEGVTWALYGDTVRGTSPVSGKQCLAAVLAEVGGHQVLVSRTRKGKETILHLEVDDTPQVGQTVTQTEARINALFGTFERHVSSRVFSQEHVARFAAATDKGRKQLLESSMGLEQFDRALALCRTDLRAAQKTVAAADIASARATGHVEACEDRLSALEQPKLPPNLVELLKQIRSDLALAKAREQVTDRALRSAQQASAVEQATKKAAEKAGAEAKVRANQAQRRIVSAGEPCPTCGQALPLENQQEVQRHYQAEVDKELLSVKVATNEAQGCSSALLELLDEQNTLGQTLKEVREKVRELEQQGSGFESCQLALDRYNRDLANAQGSLRTAQETLQERASALLTATAGVRVLEVADNVLGLRGARTLLFSQGLNKLQRSANGVLIDLGSLLRVTVSGRTTQASGKEVDAVSVKVEGAGGGEYRGASRGERNLVDIALLLAQLGSEGLIICDEIFDSLDSTWSDAVASYLGVLSRTRQVVVVTHNDGLKAVLPSAKLYRVTKVDGVSNIAKL